MFITIGGFNVDKENIKTVEDFAKNNNIKELNLNWTPETISASYARISRSEKNITELRKEAREEIEKTRNSNTTIIFDMGHSSIAEHAVFNIDIIGVSRLLSEELEKARLVSFTEKSQRYVKMGQDYLIPEEFKQDKEFLKEYTALINLLFKSYDQIVYKLEPYFLQKYEKELNEDKYKKRDLLNFAKEDARYLLPLSTLTQLGMTVNARNLENILRKFFSSNIIEFKEFAKIVFSQIENLTPSLIKYISPTDYDTKTYSNIKEKFNLNIPEKEKPEVELIDYDKDFVDNIIAGFVVKISNIDYASAKEFIKKQDPQWKNEVIKEAIRYLTKHSSLKREFELSNFRFNILISATAFAQLKRHRMATIIDGEYSPQLGVKIPISIKENKLEDFFMDNIEKVNKLYYKAKEKFEKAAAYLLTNAHRKNIILQCNFRELTHITRLRSDSHAQWDIRDISNMMIEEIKKINPFISLILCGKNEFESNFFKLIQ